MENLGGELPVKGMFKKRSLHAVNAHFFAPFNNARASEEAFQRFSNFS